MLHATAGVQNSNAESFCTPMENSRMLTSMQFVWRNLQGFRGRVNSVCVTTPMQDASPPDRNLNVVVFLGGDVQTFRDDMKSTSERRRFNQWNLEQCGAVLRSKFPASVIVVVEPCRFGAQTFACYDNFVATTHDLGIPLYDPDNVNCWRHLHSLLENIYRKLELPGGFDMKIDADGPAEDFAETPATNAAAKKTDANFPSTVTGNICLIGFSKGACVLNQLMLSLRSARQLLSASEQVTLSRIADLYFLDAGHNGARNVYLTEPSVIDNLIAADGSKKIRVHLHVTPYQMTDVSRPWIAEEAMKFADLCSKRNVLVRALYHIAEAARNSQYTPTGCKPLEIVYDLLARDRYCFYESSCVASRSIDFHFKIIELFTP